MQQGGYLHDSTLLCFVCEGNFSHERLDRWIDGAGVFFFDSRFRTE